MKFTHYSLVILLMHSLLLLPGAGQDYMATSSASRGALSLTGLTDASLEEFVGQRRELPLSAIEELGRDLISLLRDGSVCRDLHPKDRILQQTTMHDLKSVRGRAAWTLERLLKAQLPPLTSETENDDIDAATAVSLRAMAIVASVRQARNVQMLSLEERKEKAASPTTSSAELDGLSRDMNVDVRKLVALNYGTRVETLWRLENDPNATVKLAVLENPTYSSVSPEEKDRYWEQLKSAMRELFGNDDLYEFWRQGSATGLMHVVSQLVAEPGQRAQLNEVPEDFGTPPIPEPVAELIKVIPTETPQQE